MQVVMRTHTLYKADHRDQRSMSDVFFRSSPLYYLSHVHCKNLEQASITVLKVPVVMISRYRQKLLCLAFQ